MRTRTFARRRFTKAQQKYRGAALIEFAFVLILLLMIVGAIIEFGRVFWYYDALTKATRDGARFLSTSSIPLDTVTAIDLVDKASLAAKVPGFDKDLNVAITCDPTCDAPQHVTVSIQRYRVPIGGWIPVLLPKPIGEKAPYAASIAPHTTMRYMQN